MALPSAEGMTHCRTETTGHGRDGDKTHSATAIFLLKHLAQIGRVLRRVDILGDVRRPSKPVSEPDSLLPPPPKVKPAFVDTCRAGMTCIEDYSDSTMRGMTRFYQALDELAKAPRPVRIAYFGDSFIEADILTADLRETPSLLRSKNTESMTEWLCHPLKE